MSSSIQMKKVACLGLPQTSKTELFVILWQCKSNKFKRCYIVTSSSILDAAEVLDGLHINILWEYFNNPALLCSNMTPIHFKNKYSCSFSIDFMIFNTTDIYIEHNWHTSDPKNKRNSWFRLFKSNLIWFENIRGYFGKRKIFTIFERDIIYYHSFPLIKYIMVICQP